MWVIQACMAEQQRGFRTSMRGISGLDAGCRREPPRASYTRSHFSASCSNVHKFPRATMQDMIYSNAHV